MSTLYIRLPGKFTAENTTQWRDLACPFALVSDGGAILDEGASPLSDIKDLVGKAQSAVLLLAASDVTLLQVEAPPLSASRLKAALPNLVEDLLLADPSACVIAAGASSGGLRTVAVAERALLDLLSRTLVASGLQRFHVLPAQLCLPYTQEGSEKPGVAAAINPHGSSTDIVLRLSEHEGMGLTIAPQCDESDPHEAMLQTLHAIAPDAPITLYAPQTMVRNFQEAAARDEARRITVIADNWRNWIAGANDASLELLTNKADNRGMNWNAWRWPLTLLAAVLVINTVAMNLDWWRMKGEANALRAAMIQTYRKAYPQESVIIDPVAQMQQKLAFARHAAGQPVFDDFTALLASFGDAWAATRQGSKQLVIAGLEYHDRSLLVRYEGSIDEAFTQKLKAALAGRHLSYEPMSGKQTDTAWRIRSLK